MTGAVRRSDAAVVAAGVALAVIAALATVRAPVMPDSGLDPSWAYAIEDAARKGWVFGRDVIFAYGPYQDLVTGLYAPGTFWRDVFYEVFCVAAMFWTPVANRSLSGALALAIALAAATPFPDALDAAAIFGVFLIATRGGGLASLPFVALIGPLALAKYSLALVILPLLLLADARRVGMRRWPVLTATFVLATALADVAAGQPLSAAPQLIGTTLQVVLGYGAAMQLAGPSQELALALALGGACALLALVLAWRARRSDGLAAATVLVGFAWALFMVFKMGFVRQDAWHTPIWRQALPLLLALVFAALARAAAWNRAHPLFWALFVIVMLGGAFWQTVTTEPGGATAANLRAYAAQDVTGLESRLGLLPAWLAGGASRLPAARQAAVQDIARDFPPSVTGSVDAAPTELSEIIASGLDYDPRPVIQSYSAFTPALQRLDLAHLDGGKAPQTLFLQVDDIDGRLPTLALGPSLPIVGERYDVVGRDDDLGLILRLRATPRAAQVSRSPEAPLPLDQWVATPRTGALLMARVVVKPSLAGKLYGFLFRSRQMRIQLRTADGHVVDDRFIPGMAELGVAISPLPADWRQPAPLFDPSAPGGAPVVGMRISTDGAPWAFAGASVQFEQIAIAPGFAAAKAGAP